MKLLLDTIVKGKHKAEQYLFGQFLLLFDGYANGKIFVCFSEC